MITSNKNFMKRITVSVLLAAAAIVSLSAAPAKLQTISSPDGRMELIVNTDGAIRYTLSQDGVTLLENSEISMTLTDGTVYGGSDANLRKVTVSHIDETAHAVAYKKSEVRNCCNEAVFQFKGYSVIFRVYDSGMAYRFVSQAKEPFNVKDEQADFRFPEDWEMYAPYVVQNTKTLESQFENSFENTYTHSELSKWNKERYAFLPLLVEAPQGKKMVITEADLSDYPGMLLYNHFASDSTTLSGEFAPLPDKLKQGGFINVKMLIESRKPFIAACKGARSFPWRTVVVSSEDRELADCDMVWNLSKPAADIDWSWVKPGKVAWDWWNTMNLRHVDFATGINTPTYKYFIDFAASHGIEYVILDEGWSVPGAADLMQVIPEIDMEGLVNYADEKGVGLILWAGYASFANDMENVCKHYSEMGIKGFKVDFMDRDDQLVTRFMEDAAAMAAKYHLLLDMHGIYKPTGLYRTYPNMLNYEGIFGLEQAKWMDAKTDMVTYDVTIPFVRMLAGPMDYTQGAMRNANKANFRPVYTEPMSQGTRCRQLAEYVIFEAPLGMLCDSPSNYMDEPECTEFIASVPTVWDETVALDGKVAKYVAIARRSGDTWYVGAMNGWDAMNLMLDLSFLGEGSYTMEVFCDGVNADKTACDYRKETIVITEPKTPLFHLAPGGGWVAKIVRK